MNNAIYTVSAGADELTEGLFGQIVLHVLEILPYLFKHSIFPAWDIRSKWYGVAPHYRVLPGVFDLAYVVDQSTRRPEKKLASLRDTHPSVIGGNWPYVHQLWHSYFRVPDRIVGMADRYHLKQASLGLHYRGTDKNESWHTNPITQDTFIRLIKDFIDTHDDIDCLFVATDEPSFIAYAKSQLAPIPVVNAGEVEFHKKSVDDPKKADRALLDCLLLSRCRYVLKGSSALSGFAKVLNPNLEIYRVSASKLFADIPYFPDAYIPRLTSTNRESSRLLAKQFEGDWLDDSVGRRRFHRSFSSMHRHRLADRLKRRIRQRVCRWLSQPE